MAKRQCGDLIIERSLAVHSSRLFLHLLFPSQVSRAESGVIESQGRIIFVFLFVPHGQRCAQRFIILRWSVFLIMILFLDVTLMKTRQDK